MIRVFRWAAGLILGAISGAAFLAAQTPSTGASQGAAPVAAPARGGGSAGQPGGGGGPNSLFLAPKPTSPAGWIAPNKPWTKLSELLAKHARETDWTETIVSDDLLHADYISMAPGKKTPRRMNADTREWWIVQDGQVR